MMDFMFIWMVCSVCIIGKCFAEGPLPPSLNKVTGCYGHGDLDRDFLRLQCQEDERIAVYSIEHAGKLNNASCPAVLTANDTDIGDCCTVDTVDCHFRLPHSQTWNYFQQCSGLRECSVRVGRERAPQSQICDGVLHMELSNYMVASYYCIPESSIHRVEHAIQVTSANFHVSHMSYPTNMTSHNGYQCYVNTACESTINAFAIDLQLGCNQWLEISDGSAMFNMSCSVNNEYYIRSIYTTSSHVVGLTVPTGFLGQFWFYISGSSPNDTLTINCGQQGLAYTGNLCTPSAIEQSSDELLPSELYLSSVYQTTQRDDFEESLFVSDLSMDEMIVLTPIVSGFDINSSEITPADVDSDGMYPESSDASIVYDSFTTESENTEFYTSDIQGSDSIEDETYETASATSDEYSEVILTDDVVQSDDFISRANSIGVGRTVPSNLDSETSGIDTPSLAPSYSSVSIVNTFSLLDNTPSTLYDWTPILSLRHDTEDGTTHTLSKRNASTVSYKISHQYSDSWSYDLASTKGMADSGFHTLNREQTDNAMLSTFVDSASGEYSHLPIDATSTIQLSYLKSETSGIESSDPKADAQVTPSVSSTDSVAFSPTLSTTTTTDSTTLTVPVANRSQLPAIVGGTVGVALLVLATVAFIAVAKRKHCSNKVEDVKAEEGENVGKEDEQLAEDPETVDKVFPTSFRVPFRQVAPIMTVQTTDHSTSMHAARLPPLTNNKLQTEEDDGIASHQSGLPFTGRKQYGTSHNKHVLSPIDDVPRFRDEIRSPVDATVSVNSQCEVNKTPQLLLELNMGMKETGGGVGEVSTMNGNSEKKKKKKKKKHKRGRKKDERAGLNEHSDELGVVSGNEESGHSSPKKKKRKKHKKHKVEQRNLSEEESESMTVVEDKNHGDVI